MRRRDKKVNNVHAGILRVKIVMIGGQKNVERDLELKDI